jgi:hypothetical protein
MKNCESEHEHERAQAMVEQKSMTPLTPTLFNNNLASQNGPLNLTFLSYQFISPASNRTLSDCPSYVAFFEDWSPSITPGDEFQSFAHISDVDQSISE